MPWSGFCPLAAVLLLGLACAPQKPLDAHALLACTPAAVQARLGDPKQYREETEKRLGFMRWEDVGGVKVFAAFKKAQIVYVTYNFAAMAPFDEAEAFRTIGLDPPQNEPKKIDKSGAKRWRPFGKYARLTVNPATKLISIGAHPFVDFPEEREYAAKALPAP